MKKRVIIMGAAGRDFHNFNTVYRDNPDYEVVAFTAAQIPGIAGRRYPPELAGKLYPDGLPIYPESELEGLIKKLAVNQVVFAYSDVTHDYVMHKASLVLASGADFSLLGPASTMLSSTRPVISVTAVRTGAGKSQVTRKITQILKKRGRKVVVIRHPMPYGNLADEVCQRYATFADLDRNKTTIEEREEYVPHLENGVVVYAGVDYETILRAAERESDVIVWDGGNNDFSFYRSNLYIVVADPLRAGQELHYHPGETNLRLADVVIINKIDSALKTDVELVMANIKATNPAARIITAESLVTVSRPELIEGKSVLVVGDGPTLTHGGMAYGAGTIAANRYHARIVDARRYATGSIARVFEDFPHLKGELPAMGYSENQVRELAETINNARCDAVIDASPVRLSSIMTIYKPVVSVSYELSEVGDLNLEKVLAGVV
jgi:predicted GTPase